MEWSKAAVQRVVKLIPEARRPYCVRMVFYCPEEQAAGSSQSFSAGCLLGQVCRHLCSALALVADACIAGTEPGGVLLAKALSAASPKVNYEEAGRAIDAGLGQALADTALAGQVVTNVQVHYR